VHLYSQSRGQLAWHEAVAAFLPAAAAERVRPAGACRGVFGLAATLRDGACAGAAAAHAAGFGPGPEAEASGAPAVAMQGWVGALAQPDGSAPKAFVDWQNDVTTRDLAVATREGFRSIEHIKRYTTTGMATDQGKTSNLNALGLVSRELGVAIPDVGLTTFRMPYTPVTFGSFAGFSRGALFDPVRTTPTHSWAQSRGAVFEDVGAWKRARYFPLAGENLAAAVARECLAVRNQCGMFDASTLGKIEIVGTDAVTFLERFYVNSWRQLAVGRCRYGLLLGENGFVLDDGVIARLAADRFHVTTTTGGAARVLALMEDYLQTEWSDLSVWLTSISEQWAVIALQGPESRRILQELVEEVDLSPAALPHMSVVHGRICGVPMRLWRVSFTGELGFEVNVPADFGLAVWDAIYAAGRSRAIVPYGTEAMHVLRAEKGYIIVGQDTDGTVTLDDAGLAWTAAKKQGDFVGRRSLSRPAMTSPFRKQLVGLLTKESHVVLEEGSQLIEQPSDGEPRDSPPRPLGHVTSAYWSAVLGRSIALALLSGGRSRMGQTLLVLRPGANIPVEVTSTVFYDPEGKRLMT
jgi:sarcosine oxidase subunit alpha